MQKLSRPEDMRQKDVGPDIILVGGGPVDYQQLSYWHGKSRLIAVDGGLNQLMDKGIYPEMVIGDMDSADPSHIEACRAAGIPVKSVADQNSTDLEKALQACPEALIVGLGFLDGRIDHSLAALHALVCAGGVGRVLLIGAHDALIVCDSEVSFALPEKARLSVWPIGQVSFASSTGLVWPLDGLVMEVGVQTGTSNSATGGEIIIAPKKHPAGHAEHHSAGAYALLVAPENCGALYDGLLSSELAG